MFIVIIVRKFVLSKSIFPVTNSILNSTFPSLYDHLMQRDVSAFGLCVSNSKLIHQFHLNFCEIRVVKIILGAGNHYNLMTEFWVADTPPNADTSRCIKWSYNEGKVEFRIELVTGKNTSSSWGVNSSATIRVRRDSHHWHLFTLLFTIICAFNRCNHILLITVFFKEYNALL